MYKRRQRKLEYNKEMNRGFTEILVAVVIALGVIGVAELHFMPSISSIKQTSSTPTPLTKNITPTPIKSKPEINVIDCGVIKIDELEGFYLNEEKFPKSLFGEGNAALMCLGKNILSCTSSKMILRDYNEGDRIISVSGTKSNCSVTTNNQEMKRWEDRYASQKYICPMNELGPKIELPAYVSDVYPSQYYFRDAEASPGYYAFRLLHYLFKERNDGPNISGENALFTSNPAGVCKAPKNVVIDYSTKMTDCGSFDFKDPSLELSQGALGKTILTTAEQSKALVCLGNAVATCLDTKISIKNYFENIESVGISGGSSNCAISLYSTGNKPLVCPLKKIIPHTPFFVLSSPTQSFFNGGDFKNHPGYSMLMTISFLPSNIKESTDCN